MKRWGMLLAALSVLAFASKASAEGFEPLRNIYVAAGPVVSFAHGDAINTNIPGTLVDFENQFGKGVGFFGCLGAPITDHLYGQLGFGGDFFDKNVSNLEIYWFTAEIKATPFRGRFQPYLLGGLGVSVGALSDQGASPIDDTNVEFTYVFGAGMDVYVRPSVAIEPEIRIRGLHDGKGTGLDLFPVVNLGVNFLFVFQ